MLYQIPFQSYYVYGIVILSSIRALKISGTLVAGLEKSISLRYLQVPFSILHFLAVSLWPILSSSIIISCSQLNHFYSESYCGSSAQVLFSLILVKNSNMQSKVGVMRAPRRKRSPIYLNTYSKISSYTMRSRYK